MVPERRQALSTAQQGLCSGAATMADDPFALTEMFVPLASAEAGFVQASLS